MKRADRKLVKQREVMLPGQKYYTVFKPGDVVRVVPSERAFWDTLNRNGRLKEVYTVKNTYPVDCRFCTGHTQHLEMTDGSVLSGSWFDPNTKRNSKIDPRGCSSGGDYGDGEYEPPSPWHEGPNYY